MHPVYHANIVSLPDTNTSFKMKENTMKKNTWIDNKKIYKTYLLSYTCYRIYVMHCNEIFQMLALYVTARLKSRNRKILRVIQKMMKLKIQSSKETLKTNEFLLQYLRGSVWSLCSWCNFRSSVKIKTAQQTNPI